MSNYLINTDSNLSGIFRVIIIYKVGDEQSRIFIPGQVVNPLNSDGTLNEAVFEENKLVYPLATWNSKPMRDLIPEDKVLPGWIVYESGDAKRPIIIGYLGKGLDMADEWSIEVIYNYVFLDEGDTEDEYTTEETESSGSSSTNNKSKQEKIDYLFDGNGLPTSQSSASKYQKTIKVDIINENGIRTQMNITVHEKLANDVKSIFKEIADSGFRIISTQTGAYNYRNIAGSNKLSQHSYGTSIDINWNYNPMVSSNTKLPKSQYAVTSEVVNIFSKHGWDWGGNWTSKKDYMHFTYLGG